MKQIRGIALAVVALFGSTLGAATPVGITLIGRGFVPGGALDKSGLTGNICQAGTPANCVPNALFGGFGSALTYTGHNHKIDLLTERKHEYVYVLDAINRGQGVSEILAINDHEFLVVERDNRSNLQTPPQAPTRKTIYKIDINGATDVSGVDSLPAGPLPEDITPVKKTLFIDLLDPAFNLAPTIAEKIEALAWGPNLPDGRHVLYIVSDNDLNPNLDTQLYAFAIDPSLIDFERQFLPLPVYPPWLVPRD